MGESIFRSRGCFVCGTGNPCGLNVAPEHDGDKVVVQFTPGDAHRGFSKAVHGGITASLLDEVVGVASGLRANAKCATVELTIGYKRPLMVGQPVRAEGWFVEQRGKLVFGAGQILDGEGRVLATAQGKFLMLDETQAAQFTGDDD